MKAHLLKLTILTKVVNKLTNFINNVQIHFANYLGITIYVRLLWKVHVQK